jgi:hypothetical protein
MGRAAAASDHHQPSPALSARLASVTAASSAPARLTMPSPRSAELSSLPARRSLARASTGRTRIDDEVSAIPTVVRSGVE